MFNPPKDASGEVIPHDEPNLAGSSGFIRFINPDFHVVPDDNTGGKRISSAAFKATNGDPSYGMSGDLEQSVIAGGLDAVDVVPTGFGAVRLLVSDIRGLGHAVGSDPILPGNQFGLPPDPHHGQAWGVKTKTHSQKLLRAISDWVVPIPGVALR